MVDIDISLEALLGLAQIALVVIAVDAVSAAYLDFSFLTGFLRDFAYAGGAVGAVDQVYWLATDRLPKLANMY